jgi:hypothetical protein
MIECKVWPLTASAWLGFIYRVTCILPQVHDLIYMDSMVICNQPDGRVRHTMTSKSHGMPC